MRNLPHRILVLTIATLGILVATAPSLYARTFSNIVAFGDSLTDHNGLKAYENTLGQTIPEAWTNCPETGPCVWVEYLAAEWNANLENFAIGGAMTEGHVDVQDPLNQDLKLGLVGQVDRYTAGSPAFDADDTLFTVWIGGNDLLQYFDVGEGDGNTLINNAMENITEALNALENAGAEYFLVLSLPDISKSPYFINEDAQVQEEAQVAVTGFNSALEVTVKTFETLHPDATVYRFNVFSFMNGLISDGTFANTTDTLLIFDASGNVSGVRSPAEDYLFWDAIHPTTRAHELVGEAAAEKVADHDDDDDDSTCFISTAAGQEASVSSWIIAFGFFSAVAISISRLTRQ